MGGSNTRPYRRWARLALLIGVLLVPGSGVPAQAEDPLDPVIGNLGITYPDLVPDVREVGMSRQFMWDEASETFVPDYTSAPNFWFDTWSQNLGTVSLEVTVDTPEDLMNSTVSQCVSWRTDRLCREKATTPAGSFTWHDEHKHFHYEDFATYELRRFRKSGAVNYSARGLVAVSEKVSFCLMDSVQVRGGADVAPWYALCNPVRQGIQPGWADIYTSGLEGQSFTLPGSIADGTYALVITMDTADRLLESDNSNNRVVATVGISERGMKAEILGRSYPKL